MLRKVRISLIKFCYKLSNCNWIVCSVLQVQWVVFFEGLVFVEICWYVGLRQVVLLAKWAVLVKISWCCRLKCLIWIVVYYHSMFTFLLKSTSTQYFALYYVLKKKKKNFDLVFCFCFVLFFVFFSLMEGNKYCSRFEQPNTHDRPYPYIV